MTNTEKKKKYEEFVNKIHDDWKYRIIGTTFEKDLRIKPKPGRFTNYVMKRNKDELFQDFNLFLRHFIAFQLNGGSVGMMAFIVNHKHISNIYLKNIKEKQPTIIIMAKDNDESIEYLLKEKENITKLIKMASYEKLENYGINLSFIKKIQEISRKYTDKEWSFSTLVDVNFVGISSKDYQTKNKLDIWGLSSIFKETKYSIKINTEENYTFNIQNTITESRNSIIDMKGNLSTGKSDRVVVIPVRVNELISFIEDVEEKQGSVDTLFTLNVRDRKKQLNKVSKSIINSIEERPRDFFMLNNGITAIVDKIKIKASEDDSSINLHNIKIINGQQTTMTLYNHWKKTEAANYDKALILIKAYEINNNNEAKYELFNSISNASNSQNAIKAKDLLSTRRFNEVLRKDLLNLGVNYVFRDGYSDYSSQFKSLPKIKLDELVKSHYIYLTGEVWKRSGIGSVFDSIAGLKKSNGKLGAYAEKFNSTSDQDIATQLRDITSTQIYIKANKKNLGVEAQAIDIAIYINLLLKKYNDKNYELNLEEFANKCTPYTNSQDRNNFYKSMLSVSNLIEILMKEYNMKNTDEFKRNQEYKKEALERANKKAQKI